MNDPLKDGPGLIREAAKSPLGLLALSIFLVSIVALAFFTTASELVKVVIFVLLLVGAGLFIVKVLSLAAAQSQTDKPKDSSSQQTGSTVEPANPISDPKIVPDIPKPPPGTEREGTPPQPNAKGLVFDWAIIPEGYFLMGSNKKQYHDALSTEKEHRVELPEYRIAKAPVTVAQFRRFMDANKDYKTSAEKKGGARDYTKEKADEDWPKKQGAYWEHPHGPGSDVHEDHPVTCISWEDAVAFCKWAEVRLPTEAEWEKAAGWDPVEKKKYIYPWGNQPPDKNLCNFAMNVGDTTPVPVWIYAEAPKNPEYPAGVNGLYDMAGNVWEWTSSLLKEYPYKADDRENPKATGERVL